MRTSYSSNQGHITAKDFRTKIYHNAIQTPSAVDGTKTTPKAKRKAPPWNFFKTNHVVIQNLLYRLLLPLLFFIQARRTGFAALKWQATLGKTFFEIFYSYSNYLFFALSWRLLWVQSWHALAGWEAGKYLKHFAWRRERSQRSLVFGLDVSILFTSFPYMFSTFVERIPDVGNLEPVRFVVFRDRGRYR